MTAEIVPLRQAEPKPETQFNFSKTSLRKAVEAFADDTRKTFMLRDTGTRGLALRKQAKGWTFVVDKKCRGKVWRVKISDWTGHNDIAHVRAEAAGIVASIEAGTYATADTRRADLIAQDAANDALGKLRTMTVEDALALHREVNPQLRDSTVEAYGYSVADLCDGKPLEMVALTTPMIRTAYDRLCADKSPATGNRMLRTIRALWTTWASEHPEGEEPLRNPVTGITRRKGRVLKVAPREGALATHERLAWLFAALKHKTSVGAALRFLFLTGLRRDEALTLRWDNVSDDTITLPADRMKGGVELVRPITPGMREILDAQRDNGSPWVFNARVGDGHVTDTRKTLRKVNADAGVSITNHDLRRGYAVAAALAGIPDVGVKLLLGHSTSDVTDGYKKALRAELPRLAERIEAELMREVS